MATTYEFKIGLRTYTVHRQDNEVDNILYDVFLENDYLFTMGINEDAQWEATSEQDEDLVKQIGDLIERKEM